LSVKIRSNAADSVGFPVIFRLMQRNRPIQPSLREGPH
jgi:hypothetical protein